MKKVNLKLIAVAIGFAMLGSLSSCKYDEGGMSLASKKGRVANTWKISESSTDGTVDACDAACQTERDKATYEFTKDGKFTFFVDGTEVGKGTWEFTSDKTGLIFCDEDGANCDTGDEIAKIIKLKKNEMKLETTSGGSKSGTTFVSA